MQHLSLGVVAPGCKDQLLPLNVTEVSITSSQTSSPSNRLKTHSKRWEPSARRSRSSASPFRKDSRAVWLMSRKHVGPLHPLKMGFVGLPVMRRAASLQSTQRPSQMNRCASSVFSKTDRRKSSSLSRTLAPPSAWQSPGRSGGRSPRTCLSCSESCFLHVGGNVQAPDDPVLVVDQERFRWTDPLGGQLLGMFQELASQGPRDTGLPSRMICFNPDESAKSLDRSAKTSSPRT